jgi:hypothetical protein
MSSSLPDRPPSGSSPVPAYRLTGNQVEAVIRRAVELQAREAEGGASSEGMTAEELVRISTELGLSARHIQQALAEVEVAGDTGAERGVLTRLFGPGRVTATRTVSMSAPDARRVLDEYLRGAESMVVQRRIGDVTLYEEGSGIGAAIARVAAKASARHAPLHLKLVETAVRPVDESSSYVVIAADISSQRTGAIAATTAGGLGGGLAVGLTLHALVMPPLALAGLPILFGVHAISATWYRGESARVRTRLESLLDRLEHGELQTPPRGVLGRFGI